MVDVQPFSDEYEFVAPLYSVAPATLCERDARQSRPPQRWFAHDGHQALGAVVTWLRPDNRLFLTFHVKEIDAYRPLIDTVHRELGRPLSTMIDADQGARVAALLDSGFAVEASGDRFRIRFEDVLGLVNRAWVPTGYAICPVDTVDERKALHLDNAIRNLVPGTDGWRGDEDWFRAELESPEFDSAAYLIAIEQATDSYAGLIRMWRNTDGPRLGLIGVLPEHRSGPLAAGLLKQSLGAASRWGHQSFVTETSPNNRHIYPRLTSLNPERLGRFLQLIRR